MGGEMICERAKKIIKSVKFYRFQLRALAGQSSSTRPAPTTSNIELTKFLPMVSKVFAIFRLAHLWLVAMVIRVAA